MRQPVMRSGLWSVRQAVRASPLVGVDSVDDSVGSVWGPAGFGGIERLCSDARLGKREQEHVCNESMAVPSFSIYFPLTWNRTWKRYQLICRPPATDAQASPRLSESYLTISTSIIQLARWSAARRRFCLLRASCGRSVLGRGPGKGGRCGRRARIMGCCDLGNSDHERGMPVLLCCRLCDKLCFGTACGHQVHTS